MIFLWHLTHFSQILLGRKNYKVVHNLLGRKWVKKNRLCVTCRCSDQRRRTSCKTWTLCTITCRPSTQVWGLRPSGAHTESPMAPPYCITTRTGKSVPVRRHGILLKFDLDLGALASCLARDSQSTPPSSVFSQFCGWISLNTKCRAHTSTLLNARGAWVVQQWLLVRDLMAELSIRKISIFIPFPTFTSNQHYHYPTATTGAWNLFWSRRLWGQVHYLYE
jgi:hypothetical protein